jgi:acyl-coenzyme A thioesterase 13
MCRFSIRYLKAAKVGQNVLVKAAADKIGKNVAFLSVKIVDKGSGDVLVEGKHTKYIV